MKLDLHLKFIKRFCVPVLEWDKTRYKDTMLHNDRHFHAYATTFAFYVRLTFPRLVAGSFHVETPHISKQTRNLEVVDDVVNVDGIKEPTMASSTTFNKLIGIDKRYAKTSVRDTLSPKQILPHLNKNIQVVHIKDNSMFVDAVFLKICLKSFGARPVKLRYAGELEPLLVSGEISGVKIDYTFMPVKYFGSPDKVHIVAR